MSGTFYSVAGDPNAISVPYGRVPNEFQTGLYMYMYVGLDNHMQSWPSLELGSHTLDPFNTDL